MSFVADSFKPPCLFGHYPCISTPSSKDCAIIDTCSKDLYFCKFAKLQLTDGVDISCNGTVLPIGTVHMEAVLVPVGVFLSENVLEAAANDSKRR